MGLYGTHRGENEIVVTGFDSIVEEGVMLKYWVWKDHSQEGSKRKQEVGRGWIRDVRAEQHPITFYCQKIQENMVLKKYEKIEKYVLDIEFYIEYFIFHEIHIYTIFNYFSIWKCIRI